ncbi:MAG: heparinase II/III domain-containing protein [Mycobacteriales bacterium]
MTPSGVEHALPQGRVENRRWVVDVEAARAQCFGATFEDRPGDDNVAQQLLAGQIRLPPHPPATVPHRPDWQSNAGDSNWQFQLHRLLWLDVLRRYASRHDDAAALDRYEFLLRDWITSNPPYRSRPRWAWEQMAAGQRALVLVHAATVLPDRWWLVRSLVQHGTVLAGDTYFAEAKDNHALHCAVGLLIVGAALDEGTWTALARDRVDALLTESVDEQGATNEGSIAYQLLNYRWYGVAVTRIGLAGLDRPAHAGRLDAMPHFLAHATRPDGTYEAIGDTDEQTPASRLAGTDAELAASGGRGGRTPASAFAVYDAGYVFARSGWGERERPFDQELFYSVRTRSRAAAHAHEDAGALTLHAHGDQLLFDAGKYAYRRSPERRFVRSRAAHNTVDLAGADYSPSAETTVLAAERRPDHDLTVVRVECVTGLTWVRTIVYSHTGRYLLVEDAAVVDDGVEQPVIVQRWNLRRDRAIELADAGVATRGSGPNLDLVWLAGAPRLRAVRGQTDPMLGWRSPRYGVIVDSPVVEASVDGPRARLVTAVLPRAPMRRSPDVHVDGVTPTTAGHVVQLRIGSTVERISLMGAQTSFERRAAP